MAIIFFSEQKLGVGVAILATVVALKASHPLGFRKVSTVTGIVGVGVAIFVTVVAFAPSEACGLFKGGPSRAL